MKQILVVYYSQSGETAAAAGVFAAKLAETGAEITLAPVEPAVEYPYPWRSIRRFFDQMPEAILGHPPQVRPPPFDPRRRYDLVVIACPIWFLSPAPVLQAFFESPPAAVLEGADVMTITVGRAMWQQGSEALKRRLAAAGAVHIDNIVVTHQGSPIATLVSTPRTLLFGRRDRMLGVFPQAGVSEADRARMARLAAAAAAGLARPRPPGASLLAGEPAVKVKRWLVVPELLAWYCFRAWAVVIRRLGRVHPVFRAIGVYGFAVFLVLLIIFGLPLVLVGQWLLSPFIGDRVDSYVSRLEAPTGSAVPT